MGKEIELSILGMTRMSLAKVKNTTKIALLNQNCNDHPS